MVLVCVFVGVFVGVFVVVFVGGFVGVFVGGFVGLVANRGQLPLVGRGQSFCEIVVGGGAKVLVELLWVAGRG